MLLALTACASRDPGEPADVELVTLYAGPVSGSIAAMKARYQRAESGQSFTDLWGPSTSTASCEPDALFVHVFLLQSSRLDQFDVIIGLHYELDDFLPKGLRDRGWLSTLKTPRRLKRVWLNRGWSQPVYDVIRNVDGLDPSGAMLVLHDDELLSRQPVVYDCDGGSAG